MKPFLHSVAEAYLENEPEQLVDCCFVFPNKRSAIYFTDYIAQISRKNGHRYVHPATTTIVEFVDSFRDSVLGERMELIFILYGVYRDVVSRHHGEKEASSIDFNRFVHWADVLLNDFDDVDNSMADTEELFKNVGNLKEISANYLTPEQIEVIRRFWSEERVPQEVQEFWNHVAHPAAGVDGKSIASVGFLRLWQVMDEIYHNFQTRLDEMGLHTSGMAYRDAAMAVKSMDAGEFMFKRYVFVGFNNLSQAEYQIFARLRDLHDSFGNPLGDFYWDNVSPAFCDPLLAGGRQVMKYAEEFPSRFDCVDALNKFPEIEIVGVPSRAGQSKAVSGILGTLFPAGSQPDSEALRQTAIVLPEENMLVPLMDSLPAHLSPLNITMGYKLRNTAVAGLIRDIVSMQMRAYQSRVANTFFHEDVINVLSHPLVRAYRPDLCTMLLLRIQQKRLFNVPESMFREPPYAAMEPVFRFVADKNRSVDVFDYLLVLLRWLSDAVKSSAGSMNETAIETTETDGSDDYDSEEANMVDRSAKNGRTAAIQEAFLRRYTNAVLRLRLLCERYLASPGGVFMENSTVFGLAERLVQGEMLNFEGMPLHGLQIMGVLEARSLDFETILIPSMNERIFPRARFTASFIPAVLRNAYRLPTPEDEENVYSYFFYRMISRAKRVFLLYDARATGLKSRQMSRYIHQLQHIFQPKNMRKMVLPYKLTSIGKPDIIVEKTPEIMRIIDRYRSETEPLYLSASSIKQYVGCPMSFYFEKIAHYRREDDINDWVDESTYGTIVHDVFEKLFGGLLDGKPDGVTVTADMLDGMRRDIVKIDKLICRAVNEFYRNLGDDSYEPLTGDVKLIGRLIREYVAEVLRKEMAQAPFVYLHGEWEDKKPLVIRGSNDKGMTVNFNCRIDRVDRYIGDGTFPRIRIIDYKTGSDDTSVVNLEQMFHDFKKKAFMQVMLYAQAYGQFNYCNEPIQPMVYSIRSLMISPITPLKGPAPSVGEDVDKSVLKRPATGRGSWNILDYRDYVTEFNDMLLPYLEELFNPDEPFRCAENNDACKYCAFTAICQRDNKF